MTTLPTTTPMRLPRPVGQTPLAVAAPAHTQAAPSFSMNGADVWRVIRSHLWLILGMFAVFVGAGVVLNMYLARYHSSFTAYGYIEVNNVQQFKINQDQVLGTDAVGLALNQKTQAALLKQE